MVGNPADEFAVFERKFAADARRAAAGQAAATGVTAFDETGTVAVTLNSAGQVQQVQLTADAKHVLGFAGIGPSVHEAATAAAAARLTAWAEAYTDDGTQPGPGAGTPTYGSGGRQGPADTAAGTPPAGINGFADQFARLTAGRNLDSDGVRDAMHELLEVLERVDRGLDAATARARSAAAAQHSGVSSDRHVRVTVTGGGELVDVRCDTRWLRDTHEVNIGRQITAAVHAAYQAAARDSVTAAFDTGELAQVRSLLRDPAHLARMLRLGD